MPGLLGAVAGHQEVVPLRVDPALDGGYGGLLDGGVEPCEGGGGLGAHAAGPPQRLHLRLLGRSPEDGEERRRRGVFSEVAADGLVNLGRAHAVRPGPLPVVVPHAVAVPAPRGRAREGDARSGAAHEASEGEVRGEPSLFASRSAFGFAFAAPLQRVLRELPQLSADGALMGARHPPRRQPVHGGDAYLADVYA